MNKEIIIPTKWKDVTLGEFISLSLLDEESYSNPIEYYIHMLRVFGNEDIEDIFKYIKATDLESIVSQMSFVNTPPETLDVKKVNVNGVDFTLIKNMNELTLGEYITIETLIEQGKLDSVSAIPVILSVILKPVNEVFDASLCKSRIELFKKHLSIEDVLGMSVFFSNGER